MWQTRVLDAAAIVESGASGLYVEFEEGGPASVLRRRGEGRAPLPTLVRLPIPERHADAVREAKKLGRRIQVTYSRAFGEGVAELVEVV